MVEVEGKWAINDLKQTLEQRGTEPQEDTNVWIRYNPALSYPGDEIEDERKFGEADQRQVVHDFLRKAEIGILAIDATLWSDGWLENVTFPRQVLLLQNADPLKLPHFEPRHLAFLWKVRRLVIDVPWNHVAVMCLPPVNPLKRYLVCASESTWAAWLKERARSRSGCTKSCARSHTCRNWFSSASTMYRVLPAPEGITYGVCSTNISFPINSAKSTSSPSP